jgi:hypothetical protein
MIEDKYAFERFKGKAIEEPSRKLPEIKVQVLQSDQLTLLKQARDDIVKALEDWKPDPALLTPQETLILANAQHQLAKLNEMIERQERFKRWGI